MRNHTSPRIGYALLAAAGLEGCAGVGLAALAAHAHPDPNLATAAQFLALHAGAAIALASVGLRGPAAGAFFAAASFMEAGGALFAGDISLWSFSGAHAFPMAAPIGGIMLMAGWLIGASGSAWTAIQLRAQADAKATHDRLI